MKFYSGFSLKNEQHFFNKYIYNSQYSVAGFSYGAIKACLHVKQELEAGHRVDMLQLFSPAFFQTKTTQFKNIQLRAYRKNQDIYLRQFINSCFFPYQKKDIQQSSDTTIDELQELLNYTWDIDMLKDIINNSVKIEVYLGGEDKIIDTTSAKDFFTEVATITYIKNANHFLETN